MSMRRFWFELKSRKELLENKSGKRILQKGLLLEFKKDLERSWDVVSGSISSCKNKSKCKRDEHVKEKVLDLTLLEFRIELIDKNKLVRVEELDEMIFGSAEPLESYCVHLLLLKDDIYFTVLESKGSFSVYGP
ncbi:Ribonuclease II [Forsythia ovata]|uniref:Ribonuclease II n=1 Tax=Forsythia ovata TaxID=205694 RepID=A0ABD1WQW5_9LAMI